MLLSTVCQLMKRIGHAAQIHHQSDLEVAAVGTGCNL